VTEPRLDLAEHLVTTDCSEDPWTPRIGDEPRWQSGPVDVRATSFQWISGDGVELLGCVSPTRSCWWCSFALKVDRGDESSVRPAARLAAPVAASNTGHGRATQDGGVKRDRGGG
jgi:hypothetical protein